MSEIEGDVITITSVQVITAVIPVHNRADLLARLLRTLQAQTLPVAEIIVVDNASGDNAAEVAGRAGCRVISDGNEQGFRSRGEPGLAGGRNTLGRDP